LPRRLQPYADTTGAAWGRRLGGVQCVEQDGLARLTFPTGDILNALPRASSIASAIWCYWAVALLDQYDLSAHLDPGDVVLDIGAHLGTATLLAGRLIGPEGRVLAVEPFADNVRCLQATLRDNAMANVTPVACAAGDRSGTIVLARATRGSQLTSLEGAGDVEVPLRPVDALVAEQGLQRLDLIKIDAEGMEREVLAGAAETIRTFRPTIAVAAYHRPGDEEGLPRLLAELHSGYRFRSGRPAPVHDRVVWAIPD